MLIRITLTLGLLSLLSTVTSLAINKKPNITLKAFRTSAERIRDHEYPAESHYIETKDGYVLNVFRIPYSHKLQNQNSYRPAILLQHGLTSNSDCWLGSGPNNSLSYLLVDAGYDVWLGNARGNIYSRNNTRLSPDHPKFWHFSWHEIGTIDIAAMIDYILAKTGQSAIHYTGHSQGTTVYLALMSSLPEYNKKIKSAHLLAPCAFFEHGRSGVFEFFAPLVGTPSGLWYHLLTDIELVPQNTLINRVLDTTCSIKIPFKGSLCEIFNIALGNEPNPRKNASASAMMVETHPGGAAGNQGIHYIQLYVSHEFRQYDFGEKQNMKLYGQSTPPDYDLSKITAPTYLYSSENDDLCGPPDVDTLVSRMTYLADDYRLDDSEWDHGDFISNILVKEVINDRVISICNMYEQNK